MSTQNAITKSYIQQFRQAYEAGLAGLTRAAQIYVEEIDKNPEAADEFRSEFSEWIPGSIWPQLEAVGRKCMHPRLLMGGIADKKKSSILRRLPYSLQERIFDRKERFTLLTAGGDTLNVDVMDATVEQVEQLFDGDNCRTVSEQKAFIEECIKDAKVREAVSPDVMPYMIRGNRVVFRRDTELTKRELKRILDEM